MVFELNRKICIFIISIIIIVGSFLIFFYKKDTNKEVLLVGGNIKEAKKINIDSLVVNNHENDLEINRFRRPSQISVYNNPYCFSDFQKFDENKPLITKQFENGKEVILAYYAILQSASNMLGVSGGCGSIGYGNIPYPYAYELLTINKQKKVSLDQFVDSFKKVGYINLLKLIKLVSNSEEEKYMVEIEVISGYDDKTEQEYEKPSNFVYYYGVINTIKQKDNWRIESIDYIGEAFLCAPEHGWFYLAEAVVEIIFGDNLKIINQIDKIDQEKEKVWVYASNDYNKYRFDFIRITNGYDILIQENIFKDNEWQVVELLEEPWENLKLK